MEFKVRTTYSFNNMRHFVSQQQLRVTQAQYERDFLREF